MSKREDGLRLPLRVGMKNVGLDAAFVLEQTVEDVDRLPDTARDEVAEERDIGVGDSPANANGASSRIMKEYGCFVLGSSRFHS